MKSLPFEYHAPNTPEEVVALLSELGDGAKVIAGGQSLVPIMALRLTELDHLVDLRLVEGLAGIERTGDGLRIGAATTQATVERSAEAATAVPLLARATPFIGHTPIRNRGTVGGSLAHADPAAEYPAVAVALDAELGVLSPGGPRAVQARDFFTGTWTTTLGEDELLTSATFPVWDGRCGFAVEEVAQRHGDFALAGACVAVSLSAGGEVDRCGISLFGVGSTPERAVTAESALTGADVEAVDAEEVGRAAVEDLHEVPSDLHAPADYRRHIAAVVVARALRRALEEARDA